MVYRSEPKGEINREITDEIRYSLISSMNKMIDSSGKVDLEESGHSIGFSKSECEKLRDEFTKLGIIENKNGYGKVTVTNEFYTVLNNGFSKNEDSKCSDYNELECNKIDEMLRVLNETGKFIVNSVDVDSDEYSILYNCAKYIKNNNLAKKCYIQDFTITMYNISNEGLIFINKGGMMSIYNRSKEIYDRDERIKILEEINLKLQNESLEYEKTIRDRDNKIAELTLNEKVRDKKIRFWKIISAVLGFIATIAVGILPLL